SAFQETTPKRVRIEKPGVGGSDCRMVAVVTVELHAARRPRQNEPHDTHGRIGSEDVRTSLLSSRTAGFPTHDCLRKHFDAPSRTCRNVVQAGSVRLGLAEYLSNRLSFCARR